MGRRRKAEEDPWARILVSAKGIQAGLEAIHADITASTRQEEQKMPYDTVREAFDFPFSLRPYQVSNLDPLFNLDRVGLYWEAGSGKTAGATHWMIHKALDVGVKRWVLLMPPILLEQWAGWLRAIKGKSTGLPLSVTIYRGTPKQRRTLDLRVDFILMSYDILKNDYAHLINHLEDCEFGVMADEAHAVKNIESQTHKAVKHLSEGRPLALLTGTPLTSPADAYAYVKLLAPSVYTSKRQFERLHVEEVDDYNKVTKWRNLDLLHSNMRINTTRVIRREVRSELPPITYTPIVYELDPAHAKLYNQIAEERLVEFENGHEIDAISTQALYSALQQVVINWGEFAGDDSRKPAALELIDEVMSELGPQGKLVVVANFIRTNRYLLNVLGPKYGATAVYGEVSPSNKQRAITRFVEDPHCRVILVQPKSAGFGVDGLQHVCSDMLFLEAPTTAPPFHQTAARLDRDGQENPVNCRVGIASGTVQVRMFKKLLDNDETVNAIQGGYKDLKEAIFGN